MIFRVRIDVIASTSMLIYFSKTPKGHLGKGVLMEWTFYLRESRTYIHIHTQEPKHIPQGKTMKQ